VIESAREEEPQDENPRCGLIAECFMLKSLPAHVGRSALLEVLQYRRQVGSISAKRILLLPEARLSVK
jgi:hypothetical protein